MTDSIISSLKPTSPKYTLDDFYFDIRFSQIKNIQKALDDGFDVHAQNQKGNTILHVAARYPDEVVLQMFLDAGADPNIQNKSKRTPFHYLVMSADDPSTANCLINAGADINVRDVFEMTPLHHVASRGQYPLMMKYLINAGAEVNAIDCHGRTPLHCAATKNTRTFVKILTDAGAEVNAQDNNGMLAIALARGFNRIDSSGITRVLLDAGSYDVSPEWF